MKPAVLQSSKATLVNLKMLGNIDIRSCAVKVWEVKETGLELPPFAVLLFNICCELLIKFL